MRCDSLAWARAVRLGAHRYAFRGLKPDLGNGMASVYMKMDPVVRQLVSCEKYMDDLRQAEVDQYMSADWDDEWRSNCEAFLPRLWKEAKKVYTARVNKLFNNSSARFNWADDRVEFDQMVEYVEEMVSNNDVFADFLRKHPVVAIYHDAMETWIDIDEILGFCPDCNTVLLRADMQKPAIDVTLHPYAPASVECPCPHPDLPGHMICAYDTASRLRDVVVCRDCDFADAIDSLEQPWEDRYDRPLTWPPCAPYPPRRDFAGGPLDVPPYEE